MDLNLSIFWQGCAKMTSRIGGSVPGGNWKYAHGTAHYGRNFSVKWLKVQKLFHQLPQLIYLRDSNNPHIEAKHTGSIHNKTVAAKGNLKLQIAMLQKFLK